MFNTLTPSYQHLIFQFFLSGLIGFVLGMLVTKAAVMSFSKLGLLDFPERYNLTRNKIPYPGGILFVFLLPLLLFLDLLFLPMVIGAGLLGIISFWDDRYPLSAFLRLGVHVLIATGIWGMGISIDFITNPFVENNISVITSSFLSWGLTVFWILLLQQALNWFDGIKGLAIGVSGVGFFVLGLLGMIKPELFYDLNNASNTIASMFFAGLCIGSFVFYKKGKILLGDSGSQVLGFLLATMALVSGAKIATTLLVLSVPCIDFGVVILRRVFIDKKSPLKGDAKHLHHNLSRRWGEQKTTLALVGISLGLGLLGLFTSGISKIIALGVAGVFVLCLAFWAYKK